VLEMAVKFEKKEEGRFVLDVCGYVCPHPQIYTKKSIEKISVGDVVEVVFDNPSSAETIVQMCEQVGHEVVDKQQDSGKFIYTIKKG
jgi:tRNA 2-thiouridine synthesizing protein A